MVFEQAPQDIDEYIQPQDSALLLSSLTSFSVSHFEIENGGSGDPRSVSFRFEFAENEYFEDKVLEKKFWSRRSKGGWTGLVSEPVNIKWKKGKDLTSGLLGLVNAVWEEEKADGRHWSTVQGQDFTDKQKELKEQIEKVGLGGLSFFAWFGYRGRRVSAKESKAATEKLQEQRQARKAAAEAGESKKEDEEEEDDDDDEEEDEVELEIFPDGDSLALALSDDLWPGAIKYFSKKSAHTPSWSHIRANTSQPKHKSRSWRATTILKMTMTRMPKRTMRRTMSMAHRPRSARRKGHEE